MTAPRATAVVDIVPDFSSFASANRQVDRALDGVRSSVQRTVRQVESSFEQVANSVSRSFSEISRSASREARQIQREFSQAFREIMQDAARARAVLSALLSGIGDGIGRGIGPASRFLAIFTGITAAVSGAVSALPPLIGFIIQLGEASAGVALLLPAALATGIAFMATFKLAIDGVGKAINAGLTGETAKFEKELKKLPAPTQAFVREVVALKSGVDQLKLSIGTRFFADLSDDVKAIGGLYLPLMAHNLSQVAGAFNIAFQQGASFIGSADAFDDISMILENITDVADELAPAFAPLLRIFLDVAAVGSNFLPGLVSGFGGLAKNAAAFVEELRNTGQLSEIISNGLSFFGEMFNLLKQIGGTLGAVFAAANAAGGGLFGTLTQIFTVANQFLSSMQGQELLASIFGGAQQVISALLPIILQLAGALGPIAQAILPALAAGLDALAPVAGLVASAIVLLVQAVAPLLPLIGSVLNVVLTVLAGILGEVAIFLTPLISLFSELMSGILPVLSAALQQLIQNGFAALLPAVLQILAAFQPLIPVIIQLVTQFVSALLPALLQLQTTFLSAVLPAIVQVAQALATGLLAVLEQIQPFLPTLIDAFITLIMTVGSLVEAVAPVIPLFVQMITQFLSSSSAARILMVIVGTLTTAIQAVTFVVGYMNSIIRIATAVFNALSGAASSLANIIRGAVTGALNILRSMAQSVIGVFGGSGGWLVSAGRNIVEGLISGIRSAAGRAASAAREVVSNAISAARRALGISSPSKEFEKLGKFSVQGFNRGLDDGPSRTGTDALLNNLFSVDAKGLTSNNSSQSITIAPGAIQISFNGTAPSPQQAAQVGDAIADSIVAQLARNQVRTLTRMQ